MISILMPIYNGIEYISESIPSVLEQTFQDWELIIAVNGHSPNSFVYQISKDYESIDKRIRVYDMHEQNGKANTLNAMIPYCRYDYIAILDVDDVWIDNKLEVQSKLLNSYDVIGTQCVYFGELNGIVPKLPVGDLSDFDFLSLNPIINSSSLIRKNLCFWKSDKDTVEDYELWLRLKQQNKKFYNLPNIYVKHRIHKKSAYNSSEKQQKNLFALKLLYSKQT
jgi:teichuronic acid biosynthesis glycosyltransferase TuaG